MSTNYIMSDAFYKDAVKAVEDAVAKADGLGLPKAYDAAPVAAPKETEIVRLRPKKKALAKSIQAA